MVTHSVFFTAAPPNPSSLRLLVSFTLLHCFHYSLICSVFPICYLKPSVIPVRLPLSTSTSRRNKPWFRSAVATSLTVVSVLRLQSPMEGLKVSKAKLKVYIDPSKSRDVSNAVLRELSSLLFTYSEIFDGVVLAYDTNSPDKFSKILGSVHPYFCVELKVNLLLFSPKPDMLLEGKVVKVTPESIHAVVLGLSSAIITEKDIREEFVYRTKHGQEVYASKSHKRNVIKVGTVIRFLVKSFDKEMLHVYGSLFPDHTGNILWLDKNLEVSHADRSAKKREIEGQPLIPDQDVVDGETSTFVQKLKNSKKQKIKEEH